MELKIERTSAVITKHLSNLKTKFISTVDTYSGHLPLTFKETAILRGIGIFKVPMIAFVNPTVIESTEERLEIKIPLNYRTKNHLNSMYFGALAVGADTVVGMHALKHIQNSGYEVNFVFKDFKAEYHRKALGDVHFVCDQGLEIKKFVENVINSDERQNMSVPAKAYVPSLEGQNPVASFELTLSLKKVAAKV